MNINAAYDGDIYYTIIANAFIHFLMYSYYFFTSINVNSIRKYAVRSRVYENFYWEGVWDGEERIMSYRRVYLFARAYISRYSIIMFCRVSDVIVAGLVTS